MGDKKLKWCFRIKDGLKILEPNERLSKSYLEQAKSSLLRAEKNLLEGDLLWSTVTVYYAEYYALYSFLQRIGLKCENHTCSIIAVGFLLGENNIKIINEHKNKRIDAQYYMKVDQESKIKTMLQEAKMFISNFDEIISNLNEKEIKSYRERIFRER
jgi:uncharacterized protein (UPF0332 family)